MSIKLRKHLFEKPSSYRSMIDDDNDDELLPVWWKVIKMKDKKKSEVKTLETWKTFLKIFFRITILIE